MSQVAPQEQILPFTHTSREIAQHIRANHELLIPSEDIPVFVNRHIGQPQDSIGKRITLEKLAGYPTIGLDVFVRALTTDDPEVSTFLERFSEEELRYGVALGVQEKILIILDPGTDANLSPNALQELAFYQGIQQMLLQRATPTPQQMRR